MSYSQLEIKQGGRGILPLLRDLDNNLLHARLSYCTSQGTPLDSLVMQSQASEGQVWRLLNLRPFWALPWNPDSTKEGKKDWRFYFRFRIFPLVTCKPSVWGLTGSHFCATDKHILPLEYWDCSYSRTVCTPSTLHHMLWRGVCLWRGSCPVHVGHTGDSTFITDLRTWNKGWLLLFASNQKCVLLSSCSSMWC